MKKYNIFGCVFIAIAVIAAVFSACQDDKPYGDPELKEGYLYFFPSEGRSWAEEGVTRSDVEAPIEMKSSLKGQPLYLHTEVSRTISPQLKESMDASSEEEATTRGIRYTGDVFSRSSGGSPKISNFGIYATRTSDRGVILNYVQITPDNTETYSGSNWEYPWNIKEDYIDGVWDSGTADFYAYAPYFSNSNSNGLSLDADGNGVPTLSYTVPTDVTKQLDILTAKHLNVGKGSDVELEFTHIMSAIKFNFVHGKTPDGSGSSTGKSDFKWSDGVNTYNVTVNKIQIQNVYTTGTWQVGADPYNDGRWTRTDDTKGSFTYSNINKSLDGASAPVDLNPDNEGYVFMMLPQRVPDDAKIVITCDLTEEGESTPSKNMTLQANLNSKEWLPGYTYFYNLSLSDFVYVFDYNTATAKNYTDVSYNGQSEENIFIRSYKVDSKGNKSDVNWEPQYYEVIDATAVGTGSDGLGTWKTGSNGWIHVFDRSTGTYNTEVLATHAGANEEDTENVKLFKIEIGSIMTPIIDLSMWDQYQEKRWKGRSTSNCYIVAGPGTYRIPLIYGNAWTNGKKNENAYHTSNSGPNILSDFLNYNGSAINTPFIKKDVANVKDAVLIWEEGDGTSRTSIGGNGNNEGTVVKVISTIDTSVTGEDEYNT